MAGTAGRNVARGNATAVNLLAQLQELGVSLATTAGLGGIESSDVFTDAGKLLIVVLNLGVFKSIDKMLFVVI